MATMRKVWRLFDRHFLLGMNRSLCFFRCLLRMVSLKVHCQIVSFLLGLIEALEKMVEQELENVRAQKEIVSSKLNLYDKLNQEYEQQRQLIKQQVNNQLNTISCL